MRTLGTQNVNGSSQKETDGFRAEFLTRYAQKGDEVLGFILTADETRFSPHS